MKKSTRSSEQYVDQIQYAVMECTWHVLTGDRGDNAKSNKRKGFWRPSPPGAVLGLIQSFVGGGGVSQQAFLTPPKGGGGSHFEQTNMGKRTRICHRDTKGCFL